MNSVLEKRLQQITDQFVDRLLGVVRELHQEFMGRAGEGPRVRGGRAVGRRGVGSRRSPGETQALAEKVASFIAGHKKGIRVEAMGKAMKLSTAELMIPIRKALADKLIKKTGQRRATTYYPGKK